MLSHSQLKRINRKRFLAKTRVETIDKEIKKATKFISDYIESTGLLDWPRIEYCYAFSDAITVGYKYRRGLQDEYFSIEIPLDTWESGECAVINHINTVHREEIVESLNSRLERVQTSLERNTEERDSIISELKRIMGVDWAGF